MSTYPENDSPDKALAKGTASTADVAGVAWAMLRAVGVDAQLAVTRRRGYGRLTPEVPIPAQFDDALVRMTSNGQTLYFSPSSDVAVPRLLWYIRGVLALTLDGKSDAPVAIPDYGAAENRTTRLIKATLDPNGSLTAETTETHAGVNAEVWRRSLRDEDADARKDALQNRTRRYVPGALVTSVGLEALEDSSKDLTIKISWEAEGYATAAGKRLLVNPNLYNREDASDWAPAERSNEIDLGQAYEVFDTLTLKLPEGASDVTVPANAAMNAGPVGLYEHSVLRTGGTVTAKRLMRVDLYFFPVKAYAGLKHWFSDIAANDDKPVVFAMP